MLFLGYFFYPRSCYDGFHVITNLLNGDKKSVLKEEQERVYDWLNNDLRLPVFAEAYRGAVILKDNACVSVLMNMISLCSQRLKAN